jgi:hypothetical protein
MEPNQGGDMPRITIDCSPDGDFEYDRYECHVKKNETMEWLCTGKGFYAIHLGWESPFDDICYQAPLGERISIRIPENARRGRYKYSVVVFDAFQERIFMDDPHFIIRG